MTTDTKVSELPELPGPEWKATDGVSPGVYSAAQVREYGMFCYEAALARQEADNASSPNVIYRWRALDYSGFCYGSNPPHDLPSEACLTAFYRDPEGLRSALHEISATGNLTATDKQFSRHLQQIARDALAGAAPPSAPVGHDPNVIAQSNYMAWMDGLGGWEPPEWWAAAYRAGRESTPPPAAQAVDLDALRREVKSLKVDPRKGDVVFRCGYNGAINVVLGLIDQQAGGEG